MYKTIRLLSMAFLLLTGSALNLQAQKHWSSVYSDKDISRDTLKKSGFMLIFINKQEGFDPEIVKKMKATFFEVYPKEVRTYNKQSSKEVIIIIDPEYKGVAATSGHIVRVSPEWMQKNPEDLDVVTHEVMHIVQAYPSNAGPGWITEGIADYVRSDLGVNNKAANWSLTPFKSSQNYTNAYRITARFFTWIHKNYKKDFVKELNLAMHTRHYTDKFWETQTGKTLDQLWNQYSHNPTI